MVVQVLVEVIGKPKPNKIDDEDFKQWLSGFIDGEGNFQVIIEKGRLRPMFRIRLHVDDVAILHTIKSFLNRGSVYIDRNSALFTIHNTTDMTNILFPLLDTYNLYTTKYLDYLDFKKLVQVKIDNVGVLSENLLKLVSGIISNMNQGRTIVDYDLIPRLTVVNRFWLLGFIEAEGTFGLKSLVPYFQLAQHSRNNEMMMSIAKFLDDLAGKACTSKTINKRTDVLVLSISSIDVLFNAVMPFLFPMHFQTRKSVDFYLWCLTLYIHKYGYMFLSTGRILVSKLAANMNKARYSNRVNDNPLPTITNQEITDLISTKLPITPDSAMSHEQFTKLINKHLRTKEIWVYKDGVLFGDSPYPNAASAMEAIGYSKLSKAASRTLDTGNIVAKHYTFYSTEK